jgi:branched-chain amino acid aminotransferase
MTILEEMGYSVEERKINIDELVETYKAGSLNEVFGTGTAATISLIKELRYKEFVMNFDVTKWMAAPELKKRLDEIRQSKVIDKHDWMYKV